MRAYILIATLTLLNWGSSATTAAAVPASGALPVPALMTPDSDLTDGSPPRPGSREVNAPPGYASSEPNTAGESSSLDNEKRQLPTPVVQITDSYFTLEMAKQYNFTEGGMNVADADVARALSLIQGAEGGSTEKAAGISSTPLINRIVAYTATVNVGPAKYTLLVDTGSSDTWVGANGLYVRGTTSVFTGRSMSINYGSGFFRGKEFLDRVSFNSQLVIDRQSIGAATSSGGIPPPINGILGIGPKDLTTNTFKPPHTINTVTDNLFAQRRIPANIVSCSFKPFNLRQQATGELTFGGVDRSRFTGNIHFVPVTSVSPSNLFWGVQQTLRYGPSNIIMRNSAGIMNTGTALLLLATETFNAYRIATGGVLDPATGLLRLTPVQFKNLKSLFFIIGGTTFELIANAQIWPRTLNAAIGGRPNFVYLAVADLGRSVGSGLDFINGLTFLERFYTVYDTTNKRVGIATTSSTRAQSN